MGHVMRNVLSGLRQKWRIWRGPPPYPSQIGGSTGITPREVSYTSTGVFAVIDALPDAALVMDADLNLLHGNALAQQMLGTLYVGAHITRTNRNPSLIASVQQAYSLNSRVTFQMVQRGPVEKQLEGTACVLSDSEGLDHTPVLLVILQDLSEKAALARMRVEFVANASHELRTPLASLVGFIETLRGPAKDDVAARDRFLGIMAAQAGRMSRLIDDLLILSRVEMQAHVMPTGVVELNLLIDDAANALRHELAEAGVEIIVQPLQDKVTVRGDHDELLQALQNLIQNAIKYGRRHGQIMLGMRQIMNPLTGRGDAHISVTDNGPGIPPEHLPRLTERFFRVNSPANRNKDGTGLGLAIVKHIASRHHGTLDIESEVGVGSKFSLVLPVFGAETGDRRKSGV
jgi:two-component system, OmpR family, phosphate regulon sensor histidine kinase PhoR